MYLVEWVYTTRQATPKNLGALVGHSLGMHATKLKTLFSVGSFKIMRIVFHGFCNQNLPKRVVRLAICTHTELICYSLFFFLLGGRVGGRGGRF